MRLLFALFLTTTLGTTLAGCKMIDQTLFAPDPEPGKEATPLPTATARPAGATPVMTIRYDTAQPDYRATLAQAVRTVEARRPGVVYDVVAAANAAQAAQAGKDAAAVMAAMKELGVPNNRMHLGARVEPTLSVREVRLYLR